MGIFILLPLTYSCKQLPLDRTYRRIRGEIRTRCSTQDPPRYSSLLTATALAIAIAVCFRISTKRFLEGTGHSSEEGYRNCCRYVLRLDSSNGYSASGNYFVSISRVYALTWLHSTSSFVLKQVCGSALVSSPTYTRRPCVCPVGISTHPATY